MRSVAALLVPGSSSSTVGRAQPSISDRVYWSSFLTEKRVSRANPCSCGQIRAFPCRLEFESSQPRPSRGLGRPLALRATVALYLAGQEARSTEPRKCGSRPIRVTIAPPDYDVAGNVKGSDIRYAVTTSAGELINCISLNTEAFHLECAERILLMNSECERQRLLSRCIRLEASRRILVAESEPGLKKLWTAIRAGFAGKATSIARDTWRGNSGLDQDRQLVALNFFLHNTVVGGSNTVTVDQLVWQAVHEPHSEQFPDLLAFFALNLSVAGKRAGKNGIATPSQWANSFARHHLWSAGAWVADELNCPTASRRAWARSLQRRRTPLKNARRTIDGSSNFAVTQ